MLPLEVLRELDFTYDIFLFNAYHICKTRDENEFMLIAISGKRLFLIARWGEEKTSFDEMRAFHETKKTLVNHRSKMPLKRGIMTFFTAFVLSFLLLYFTAREEPSGVQILFMTVLSYAASIIVYVSVSEREIKDEEVKALIKN